MKKLYIPFTVAVALLAMASCKSGKTENTDEVNQDSILKADSLQRAESMWTIDSAKMARLKSPDLTFCELKGPVRSMQEKGGSKYEFSRNGELLLIDGYNPFNTHKETEDDYMKRTYKRNSNGEINNYVQWETSEDYEWSNGKLTKVEGGSEGYEWHVTFNYDDNGRLRSKKGHQQMEDGSEYEEINVEFTYLDTDKYGNWTKRKAGKEVETRTITYFNTSRPMADEFSPILKKYEFSGKIGQEKDCPLQIGPDGGEYTVASGRKALRFSNYDPKSSELVIDAFKPDGKQYIGRFNGKLNGNIYKGTFTNHKGGKVSFELTMK